MNEHNSNYINTKNIYNEYTNICSNNTNNYAYNDNLDVNNNNKSAYNDTSNDNKNDNINNNDTIHIYTILMHNKYFVILFEYLSYYVVSYFILALYYNKLTLKSCI